MAGISKQIRNLRATIPAEVQLVCVSKFQPIESIREAYEAGERHFGESRVQELQRKVPQLPQDICWHFIGHLQTNKVRDLLKLRPYLIQSVDSERLLLAINEEAKRLGFVQNVLLEVHVAKEETKSGLLPDEIETISRVLPQLGVPHIRICGLMTMATNTDDEAEIRRCFVQAKNILDNWNLPHPIFSAGMSDDYRIAIECGATMVRIGSTIFGSRPTTSPATIKRPLPKAVFFDQDGVLFNSMPYHAQSWEEAMHEYGLPFTAFQAYRNEGRTGSAVIQELYQQVYGKDASDELIDAIYASKSNNFIRLTGGKLPELIPNIRDVLAYLHDQGVQCWVVTGSGQRSLIDKLQATFPGIFTGIISAFDVQHGKPHPEPYLKAWEKSGVTKEECCIIENAPLGIRAGKAAGIFTVAINTGPLPDSDLLEAGADMVLPNMNALLEWLKNA